MPSDLEQLQRDALSIIGDSVALSTKRQVVSHLCKPNGNCSNFYAITLNPSMIVDGENGGPFARNITWIPYRAAPTTSPHS